MSSTVLRSAAVVAACSLALAGCSKSDDSAGSDASATTAVSTSATTTATDTTTSKATETETTTATETATETAAAGAVFNAENFHLHDGYVKAVGEGEKMTAVFGMLENHTDTPAHLVGFSTNLDASMYQIHEVVDGVMREKKGGITIEPHSSVTLKPGGEHLMIMGLKQAVEAGSTITVTLKFEDGSSVVIKDVPARTIGAGQEDYAPGEGTMKMDHGSGETTMKMDHDHSTTATETDSK